MSKITRKSKVNLFSKKQAFYASICISLLLNMIMFIGILHGQSYHITINWSSYLSYFSWHLICNILLFFLLFLFNFWVIQTQRESRRATIFVLLGTVIICALLNPVLSKLQWLFLGPRADFKFAGFVVLNMVKDLLVGTIVIIISYVIYIYAKREQTIIANHNLIQENIRIKYEALKNQLDPHFLFNTLNTLNGLIDMDNNKAHEYIDNLSSVFRHTLYSKNVCKVKEELEFANSYFQLMKIRYGSNLQLKHSIHHKYEDYLIIPVSIQLLIENAIKHNVISNTEPLSITIETSDADTITVKNLINPKINETHGGVGLVNLNERYSILFNKSIQIGQQNGEFFVTIPLLTEITK